MLKLNPIKNTCAQALEAKKWLDSMPDRILEAKLYIVKNDLSIVINPVHDDVQLIIMKDTPVNHIDEVTNILLGKK